MGGGGPGRFVPMLAEVLSDLDESRAGACHVVRRWPASLDGTIAPIRGSDGPWQMFAGLPAFAAWRFVVAVDGFEVLYAEPGRLRGHTSAVEDGHPYAVRYEITLDDRWRTRKARVASDTVAGARETVHIADGEGHWMVDDEPAPQLDGLIDVDLEASACTNTLPIHRLLLPLGEAIEAPAAYVPALDLSVTRLDQTYRRLENRRYDYTSDGNFQAVLEYDPAGLIVDYPGIAVRSV